MAGHEHAAGILVSAGEATLIPGGGTDFQRRHRAADVSHATRCLGYVAGQRGSSSC